MCPHTCGGGGSWWKVLCIQSSRQRVVTNLLKGHSMRQSVLSPASTGIGLFSTKRALSSCGNDIPLVYWQLGTSKATLSNYQLFILSARSSVGSWMVGVVIRTCTQHMLLVEKKYKADIDTVIWLVNSIQAKFQLKNNFVAKKARKETDQLVTYGLT